MLLLKKRCHCHLFCAWKTSPGLFQRHPHKQLRFSGGQCWILWTLEQAVQTVVESPSLEIFKIWLFSSVSCSSKSWQGQGWCDLKKWFLTSTIPWNHEQIPYPTVPSMHSRDSWSLPPWFYTQPPFPSTHKHISPHTHNHTLHSSIPVNLQYPEPKSLGLFLAPCYLPDLPLPILCSKS